MTAYVSLFRSINVGGNHKVKMTELKELHEALGLRDVVTYIQSGNVVFSSDDADPVQLKRQIEDSFAERFGFHSEVIVRTSAELSDVIEKNPFQGQPGKEPNWVLVMFLTACPDATAQENLLKSYVGPEEIFIIGRELYIYYTDGIGRSKLSNNVLEKKLKIIGTGRNLNTIRKLQELARS